MSEKTPLDLARVRAIFGESLNGADELLTLTLFDSGELIARLSAAIDAHDMPDAREAAHALKGLCGNVGAVELWHLATSVERAAEADDVARCAELLDALVTAHQSLEQAIAGLREASSSGR